MRVFDRLHDVFLNKVKWSMPHCRLYHEVFDIHPHLGMFSRLNE